MDECRPREQSSESKNAKWLSGVVTPLKIEQWASMLRDHPDRAFANYVTSGIGNGFRIGFSRTGEFGPKLSSARKNMRSANENPEVIADYLREESQRGVLLGPFGRHEAPDIHLSRFGVIPKANKPGKWRLIVDLSHPEGKSVNDGISPDLCSLHYLKVDEVARRLLKLGPGALMAKLDIRSAYRMVPVHPDDRWLLGMQWQGLIYVDAALPFGLRSAPKIFNAVADALEWIVRRCGVSDVWHYLDDFFLCGPATSEVCGTNLQLLVEICNLLGIPLAMEKLEGPTTLITLLGISIDSKVGTLSLPAKKLEQLRQLTREWLSKKRCTKRELLSITGKLQHAAKVVRPGRTFLRRLFDLSTAVSKPHHHLNLNNAARSDLAWWNEFLADWNGVSIIASLGEADPTVTLTSDASGKWGCGAFWSGNWFQLAWQAVPQARQWNIAIKELIPVVMAVAIWGGKWAGQVVRCRCDNSAVVSVLATRSSRDRDIMHLLRCLAFFEARWNLQLISSHLAGVRNTLADDLSRNNLVSFLQATDHSMDSQSVIPPPLSAMLVSHRPDWTSPAWRQMFRDTVNMV